MAVVESLGMQVQSSFPDSGQARFPVFRTRVHLLLTRTGEQTQVDGEDRLGPDGLARRVKPAWMGSPLCPQVRSPVAGCRRPFSGLIEVRMAQVAAVLQVLGQDALDLRPAALDIGVLDGGRNPELGAVLYQHRFCPRRAIRGNEPGHGNPDPGRTPPAAIPRGTGLTGSAQSRCPGHGRSPLGGSGFRAADVTKRAFRKRVALTLADR
jgi:hypothetical protein